MVDDCTAVNRRQATAGDSLLGSAESRARNKANRVVHDPADRVFVAPRAMAPRPSAPTVVIQDHRTLLAARNQRDTSKAVIVSAVENEKRVIEREAQEKERKKKERAARKAQSVAAKAAQSAPAASSGSAQAPKGKTGEAKPGPIVGAPINVAPVLTPVGSEKGYVPFRVLQRNGELSDIHQHDLDVCGFMPAIRGLSDAMGDRLAHVRVEVGAFLVTYEPYKEGHQHFTKVAIKWFAKVSQAIKVGEESGLRFTYGPVLLRSELLAASIQVSRDQYSNRAGPVCEKPKNYNGPSGSRWQKAKQTSNGYQKAIYN